MTSGSSVNPLDHADATSVRRWIVLGCLVIILATLIAYIPAMGGGFIWDDDDYLVKNELLQQPGGLILLWEPKQTHQYYPMVFTSFWVEYQIWKLNPTGYHVINVLLHITNALLLWRALCLVLPRTTLGRVGVAWTIAAVFALHPVHVESVAWITERKNVLSGMFYFLALLAYLKFETPQDPKAQEPRPWGFYGLSLLFFACALLSKTVTCSLPAVLILIMLYRRQRLSFSRLACTMPLFAIGIGAALFTAYLERASVGAVGAAFDWSFADRCLIASRALLFYPWKLLLPHPLVFFYPRWELPFGEIAGYWSGLLVLVIAIAALVLYIRGRRGPAIALAFFAGTIFPALGFVNVYPMQFSWVADHFNYLASIGIIALAVAGTAPLIRNRIARRFIVTLVLITLAALTWMTGRKYADLETLWRVTLDQNPRAWMVHNNLGSLLHKRDDIEEALTHFDAALALKPDHYPALCNRANALSTLKRYDEAIEQWKVALTYSRTVPRDLFIIGIVCEAAGRIEEALDFFRQAIEADETGDSALEFRRHLGWLLALRGEHGEAILHLREVAAQDPTSVRLQRYLAGRAEINGRWSDAIARNAAALHFAREYEDRLGVTIRLAKLLALCEDPTLRRPAEAMRLVAELNRITGGGDPFILHIQAAAAAGLGQYPQATTLAEQALTIAREHELDPLIAELEPCLAAYRSGQPAP